MTWPILVEVWTTEVIGFVADLPGLQVSGTHLDDVTAGIDRALQPYVSWLIEGELLPESFSVQPISVEQIEHARSGSGPLFQRDHVVPTNEQVELALAVGRAALSDLLFVRDDLTGDALGSADQVLRHVAELDRWYATRMVAATGKPFTSLEDELVQSASLFEETVDLVLDGGQTGLRTIDGEDWTLAKVLRRRTSHLREHLPEIMALLD